MGIFCNRCRNAACVNAGWSGGKWSDRISTQVDRLLDHPQFADPSADRFDPLRKLDFRELSEGLVLRTKADPWSGPEVHLADPSAETASNSVVEDAVRALAASRGATPQPPRAELPKVDPPKVDPTPRAEPPKPVHVEPEPRRNPAYFQAPSAPTEPEKPAPRPVLPPNERAVNTPFPSGGVMIDGSPPPSPTPNAPTPGGDPWAAPPTSPGPKPIRVTPGSKVRMG